MGICTRLLTGQVASRSTLDIIREMYIGRDRKGFTLIEILVVIAIIATERSVFPLLNNAQKEL
jgi:prepilin-type N-terminal cleavage/methylation domain-containing protein